MGWRAFKIKWFISKSNNSSLKFHLILDIIKDKKPKVKINENPAAKPSIPSNQLIALTNETIQNAANTLLIKVGRITWISPKKGK